MHIVDSSLTASSDHRSSHQISVQENVHIWLAPPASSGDNVTISAAARSQQASATDPSTASGGAMAIPLSLQILALLIERLTGQSVRIFDPSQLTATSTSLPDPAAAQANAAASAQAGALTAAGYGVRIDKITTYSETEQTHYAASGAATTSDGRTINFNLNIAMQRAYSESSTSTLRLGDAARRDPLVINFQSNSAQLTGKRFAFDLNADGKTEQINTLAPGSGFLVLDPGNTGKVTNGSQLFGTQSGNGYADLAKYDADHSGWIDQNDPVFQQLKVWTKDSSGADHLYSLASLGIGAISLKATSTPFDIKSADNQLLGDVRATSVVLNENGTTSGMQQVDLTV